LHIFRKDPERVVKSNTTDITHFLIPETGARITKWSSVNGPCKIKMANQQPKYWLGRLVLPFNLLPFLPPEQGFERSG